MVHRKRNKDANEKQKTWGRKRSAAAYKQPCSTQLATPLEVSSSQIHPAAPAYNPLRAGSLLAEEVMVAGHRQEEEEQGRPSIPLKRRHYSKHTQRPRRLRHKSPQLRNKPRRNPLSLSGSFRRPGKRQRGSSTKPKRRGRLRTTKR